jgi:hypothetical protein
MFSKLEALYHTRAACSTSDHCSRKEQNDQNIHE